MQTIIKINNLKIMFKGFRDFILRGNVIDLAVAVVIGGAFGSIVTALVKDIITPLIGAIGGTPDFSNLIFTLNGSKFLIGDFLNALISFLIISAVIYFLVVLPMNTIMAKIKKGEKVDPTNKTCSECLSQIPLKATRCKFCTAVIKK
ncbi:MAG: Large-conductance mechanosensitive channel [Candidatus Shapirobacteria bacterium GW2011_GWE1_38_92]|uniref:Large-conductance mechanosensitive channel n=3 Tax=Candidatus Shapironibacteriota TaxID=1752721 RepID=A0A0G0JUY1_9BACT|nr:MAG: Large-conductance mechanosensitive channel [Candidatus Shapirobacteria bacterium GW2011_GWE2_38_30]KKQ89922.1 MAG: Large-conductance mechanosensitive channel [Candidatus Shapirobacteria bacterium GW2011_GWE1_38_92]